MIPDNIITYKITEARDCKKTVRGPRWLRRLLRNSLDGVLTHCRVVAGKTDAGPCERIFMTITLPLLPACALGWILAEAIIAADEALTS